MDPLSQVKSQAGRQLLGLVMAVLLCFGVPLWLFEATGGAGNGRLPWWSLAIIVISGACYAVVVCSLQRRLFQMVLWLFTYVFLGMAPCVQYRLGQLPSTTPNVDESQFPTAGALVILSSVAVIAGSYLARRSIKGTKTPRPAAVDPIRAHILTMTAIGVFVYYGSKVGFDAFVLSRDEFSALRASVWPSAPQEALLTGGLNMLLLVGFIAQMTLREQHRLIDQRTSPLPGLINGMILIYAVNPISSPRYVVGTVLLAMLGTLGAYATVERFRVVAIVALVGMIALFPLADIFRSSTDVVMESEGPVTAMLSGDFDAFAQIANSITFVDAHGLSWGWQLTGVLLFWVPRSLWPNKPLDTGTLIAEFMDYEFTNISSPLWSEFFVDFGWLGAVFGMGVLGYMFQSMDSKTDMILQTSRIPPVATCAIAFYLLIVLRGSLLNAASYLLVIVLASWFVATRTPITARHDPLGALMLEPESLPSAINSSAPNFHNRNLGQ